MSSVSLGSKIMSYIDRLYFLKILGSTPNSCIVLVSSKRNNRSGPMARQNIILLQKCRESKSPRYSKNNSPRLPVARPLPVREVDVPQTQLTLVSEPKPWLKAKAEGTNQFYVFFPSAGRYKAKHWPSKPTTFAKIKTHLA